MTAAEVKLRIRVTRARINGNAARKIREPARGFPFRGAESARAVVPAGSRALLPWVSRRLMRRHAIRETRMDMTRRHFVAAPISAALLGSLAGIPTARSQTFAKPVRMVIPWPAGGSTDAAGRLLADAMRGGYSGTMVVDNRPGAGGRVGLEYLKTAEADGSVFIVTPASAFVIYPHVYKKLSYDPFADFAPVTRVCKFPFAVSVGPSVPASIKTLPDFLQWCKVHPKEAFYGIAAAGSGTHFAGVMLSRSSNVTLTSVPYKGAAPAVQDLMGGQVTSTVNVLGDILPYLGSDKIRILATTGAARSRLTPDVPTVAETFPGFVAEEWFGAFVPRKTPVEAVGRLNDAIQAALKTVAVTQGFAKLGFEVAGESQGAFEALMRADLERWGPVVKASGFTVEE
jgi:tripartite-type tricarboxylate transporter receptor subunit TctC